MTKAIKRVVGFCLSNLVLWLALSPRFAIKLYQLKLFKIFGEPGSLESLRNFNDVENFPVDFAAIDGTMLHGWFYKGQGSKIFVYNMGRNSDLGKSLANARAMLAAGASVFTYEYRGFGSTAGKPSVKGICEDGLTAYDVVLAQLGYDPANIIVYGESLGAGVASFVTEHRATAGLVLQSGFASFDAIGKSQQRFLRLYPRFLFPRLLNNRQTVARQHPPLLVIHGAQDTFIPVKQAHLIFDAACEPKKLVLLPNSHHRDMATLDWQPFVSALADFLATLA